VLSSSARHQGIPSDFIVLIGIALAAALIVAGIMIHQMEPDFQGSVGSENCAAWRGNLGPLFDSDLYGFKPWNWD